MEPVTYERRGAAAVVTIDRQERRNAIDGPTAESARRRLRALRGRRRRARAGAHRRRRRGVLRRRRPQGDRELRAAHGRPARPARASAGVISPKPTIAAISGWCLAGGLELALWCDLRIATERTALGFPERRWGVPLIDGGTQRLPRIVGLGRALDLILTGRIVDAEEAQRSASSPRSCRRDATSSARSRWPRRSRASRRTRCSPTGARRSRASGSRSTEGLALEAAAALPTLETAWRGAARFAGGEGAAERAGV